jgi:hypothetical protein
MMRYAIPLVVVSLIVTPNYNRAFGSDDATVSSEYKKIAALGPGVHAVQKDKKGRITSCIVVGQARISTVLGKAKGIELAKDKAILDCSAQFVKWLKEEVTVYQSNDEESIVLIEGQENKEDESLLESGKAVEKSGKKMESLSKGLVRGLQIVHKEIDGNGKTYTLVKGWKADTAERTKKISAGLASDETKKNDIKNAKTSDISDGQKKIDKEIESGSTTSNDASDFLPKRNKK